MDSRKTISGLLFVAMSLLPGTSTAQNLVINPAFSDGNTGFNSTYTYFTGNPITEGRYSIVQNPRDAHS
jgi:hypothetical protein